jgi:hypothetical protein
VVGRRLLEDLDDLRGRLAGARAGRRPLALAERDETGDVR